VPVLAEVGDWLAIWQLPIFLVLGGVWVALGGKLLRRSVHRVATRREAGLARCTVVALLSGLAGIVSASIGFVLGKMASEAAGIGWYWFGVPIGAALFVAVSYLCVFAAFQLHAGQIAGIWIKSFGLPLLIAAIVAVPTFWFPYAANQSQQSKLDSMKDLAEIYRKVGTYTAGRPAMSLEQMLTDDRPLQASYAVAREHPSRRIGYFYCPSSLLNFQEDSPRLLACDWADNQIGAERAVLFANGRVEIVSSEKFQTLLAKADNKEFAEKLAKAEAEMGIGPGK